MRSSHRSLYILPTLLLALVWTAPAWADTERAGQTASGAHYRFIVPDAWNGGLVIWNHGFSLSPIGPVSAQDTELVELFALPQGYAVAASSYSLTGWAVFKTNQDLEQMVRAFEDEFGVPNEVLVVGASLGGIVTAAALEKADLGDVTGALTICGAVAGSRNWDGALDMRLVYDMVCDAKKTRIPGGAKGLDKNSSLGQRDVAKAVNACFGLNKAAGKRKNKQKKRLAKFLELTQIPGSFVHTTMAYVTFAMADLVYDRKKMKGKQGVGNANVNYGDADTNASIERVKPKKSKARKLLKNYTPSGNVGDVKIVSIHTDKDGLVIVENEREWAKVVPREQLSIGIVVEDEPSHCGFSKAEIIGSWEALQSWIEGSPRPTAEDLQASCHFWGLFVGGACRFDPDYEIPDMDGRVRPR
ncbi:MAG: hypothetical protein GY769_17030 [bacterium]|nr:hypothetical protein [bacterium]